MNLIGLDGTGLTPEAIAWAREHFIANVRAFGPLPTLRVGRQPYGVLPVTPLGNWTPAGQTPQPMRASAGLRRRSTQLRDRLWLPRVADVPRVGRSDDPAQDLSAVMRSDGLGGRYRLRHLLGPRYLRASAAIPRRRSRGGRLARRAGRSRRRRAAALGFPLAAATEQRGLLGSRDAGERAARAGGRSSSAATLEPNYIAALLADPPLPANETETVPPMPAPATLLHLLLRQSLQLEYRAAAARLVSRQPGAAAARVTRARRRARTTSTPQPTVTTWRMLLGRCEAATGNAAPSAFLKGLTAFDGRGSRGPRRDARGASLISRGFRRSISSACSSARWTSRRIGSMRGSRRSRPRGSPRCAANGRPACASAASAGC